MEGVVDNGWWPVSRGRGQRGSEWMLGTHQEAVPPLYSTPVTVIHTMQVNTQNYKQQFTHIE